ncbi:hypothetical protein DM02DRAFT_217329 [Periconia macrospinosa]|uniref:Uncharacterized protein n=1 Tax=Periconia macrospinosa TaxID=97972 RepID=A0A2V1D8U7_9PLEO|nr:hypothetical protein DM02DRAFT_217329 [Periconia macrospinosa]
MISGSMRCTYTGREFGGSLFNLSHFFIRVIGRLKPDIRRACVFGAGRPVSVCLCTCHVSMGWGENGFAVVEIPSIFNVSASLISCFCFLQTHYYQLYPRAVRWFGGCCLRKEREREREMTTKTEKDIHYSFPHVSFFPPPCVYIVCVCVSPISPSLVFVTYLGR